MEITKNEEKNEIQTTNLKNIDLMFYPTANSFLKGIAA